MMATSFLLALLIFYPLILANSKTCSPAINARSFHLVQSSNRALITFPWNFCRLFPLVSLTLIISLRDKLLDPSTRDRDPLGTNRSRESRDFFCFGILDQPVLVLTFNRNLIATTKYITCDPIPSKMVPSPTPRSLWPSQPPSPQQRYFPNRVCTPRSLKRSHQSKLTKGNAINPGLSHRTSSTFASTHRAGAVPSKALCASPFPSMSRFLLRRNFVSTLPLLVSEKIIQPLLAIPSLKRFALSLLIPSLQQVDSVSSHCLQFRFICSNCGSSNRFLGKGCLIQSADYGGKRCVDFQKAQLVPAPAKSVLVAKLRERAVGKKSQASDGSCVLLHLILMLIQFIFSWQMFDILPV